MSYNPVAKSPFRSAGMTQRPTPHVPSRPLFPFDGRLFAFLDVETTGLKAESGDRICEVAIQRCRGTEVLAEFKSLICPGIPISPGACAVNGISDEMVRGKPPFAKVARRVRRMLEGSVIVCHNAPFDLGFLRHEFARAGMTLPQAPVIDTLAWARRHFNFPKNSLGALAQSIGVDSERFHRAADDTNTLRLIFRWLAKELTMRRGLGTLEELLAL